MKKSLGFLVLAVLSGVAVAQSGGKIKAVGSASAVKGGTAYFNLGAEPSTLNPITSSDLYATKTQSWVLESLLGRNPDTYDWEPQVAESWEISKDKKQFTFKIRPGIKWHDGKPLTVEDVKFSFDVIFDPAYDTAHLRPYYESIAKAEIVDPQTVRFTAKDLYWGNFNSVADLTIIPKHVYEGKKAEGKLNKSLVGSGPYVLEKYEQGQRIVLKKNPEWWGNSVAELKGVFNFDQVVLRFVKDQNVAIEMLKKGDIDFEEMSPEVFVEKTKGAEWGTKVQKVQTENNGPKPYGFIGWNFKNPIFKDRDVRVGLAHLYNRKFVIEKFLYNMSVPATGPVHLKNPYASPKVKALEFDAKKAVELFKKAGWSDTDKDGVLDRVIDGKKTPFRFTIMLANADTMKWFTVYKEDAKKVGVDIELKLLEWNSFVKLLDEQKFDAVAMGWGGGSVDIEPKQIWHSSSAVMGGSNFISYKNEQVDKLIDEARGIFDRNKRIEHLRKVYELIAADAPYLFLFNAKYSLYGHTSRMRKDKDTYGFYVGRPNMPGAYWWIQK